jgi:hypothetical protein
MAGAVTTLATIAAAALICAAATGCDRPRPLDGAALDTPQKTSASAPRRIQRRRRIHGARLVAGAGVAVPAIGQAHPGEREHLHEPVDHDGGVVEEEGAVDVGREEDVVEHQQRHGEHAPRPQNVQEIRDRDEPPLGGELERVQTKKLNSTKYGRIFNSNGSRSSS